MKEGAAISSRHIVVIGGGIVGVCTALALLKDGHRVTILEPQEPGGQQAASYGNGAFVSPASIIPMSMPGLWKKVPGFLMDPQGPFTIRWQYLVRLAPWLIRFVKAGATPARAARTAGILSTLLSDAPARHLALATACGVPELIRQDGLLYVYPDREAFALEAFSWQLRRDNGIQWWELDAAALHEFEPALNRRYTFGVLLESGGHCLDPGAYVRGLVNSFTSLGGELIRARAEGFNISNARLQSVRTDKGLVVCDGAVISAGIHSKVLAKSVGDRVSLESERGYHVEIAQPASGPRIPVMPSDGKMANTMTLGGLRASGQVELAGVDCPPDWKRADILLHHLLKTYPGLGDDPAQLKISRWQGNRPSTPDGLPVIAASRATHDVVHAFGHGHVGLASAPMTAQVVASLFAGEAAPLDITPFAASRF
ncbi:amino acid dehydrogenase [Pseudomonas sp. S25]|uniref:Amino acid dehydrogenase n=1 Tax=Pseudomonas maioricensis TaxID=1766623 RepID=A0ABS9ZKT2_9PSED|nr:FAD-dependent oxidoreductase [Pseudomonas sp. S25]MCI8211189.1 amino acid dehydrogenase [Pseudomonas sp. S25]